MDHRVYPKYRAARAIGLSVRCEAVTLVSSLVTVSRAGRGQEKTAYRRAVALGRG